MEHAGTIGRLRYRQLKRARGLSTHAAPAYRTGVHDALDRLHDLLADDPTLSPVLAARRARMLVLDGHRDPRRAYAMGVVEALAAAVDEYGASREHV